MDYKKIDKVVTDFVNEPNNKTYIINLPVIVDTAKNVLKKEPITDFNDEYSCKFDINEFVEIIYDFLEKIDDSLAKQFITILYMTNDEGKPYVDIVLCDSLSETTKSMVDSDGTVHVYFSPNAYGIGTLLHEMLHKMNECNILQEGKPAMTQTDLYFNETASILGESLFYDYLLNKGYINKSDYKKALAFRLNDSKECAKTCIIENELVQLKLEGKEINLENLQNLISKYDEDTIERKIYDEERKYPERLLFIEKKGILDYPTSQRYVIAQAFSDDISKRNSAFEDFKKINNFVSSSNSVPNDVCSIYNEGNLSR